jgi:hypothetical protein
MNGATIGMVFCGCVGFIGGFFGGRDVTTIDLHKQAIESGNAYYHPLTGEFTWAIGECWTELEAQAKLDALKHKETK